MCGATTWWRNLAGLLAACVLSLLVVGPTVASANCICDGPAADTVGEQIVQTSQRHDTTPCKAACCLGGHCHHGGSWIEGPVAIMAAPTRESVELVITTPRVLASHTPDPLDDPPRC